jgi:hypothetical protein
VRREQGDRFDAASGERFGRDRILNSPEGEQAISAGVSGEAVSAEKSLPGAVHKGIMPECL